MGTDVSTPLQNDTLNAHANISSRARGLQFHPYFVRVANALASLSICSGSSEYSLIEYAARTKMMMMIFSYTDGVPRPLAKLHTRHTQFYAPTEAFYEGILAVSRHYPTPIRIKYRTKIPCTGPNIRKALHLRNITRPGRQVHNTD